MPKAERSARPSRPPGAQQMQRPSTSGTLTRPSLTRSQSRSVQLVRPQRRPHPPPHPSPGAGRTKPTRMPKRKHGAGLSRPPAAKRQHHCTSRSRPFSPWRPWIGRRWPLPLGIGRTKPNLTLRTRRCVGLSRPPARRQMPSPSASGTSRSRPSPTGNSESRPLSPIPRPRPRLLPVAGARRSPIRTRRTRCCARRSRPPARLPTQRPSSSGTSRRP
mmetsp:Transcript_79514/g.246655  ORF Transcript_79514/g.246655 Transcript_79514/m.246655 type:complete len:217 (+) Transcript_79514:85-735(+)